jgi:hypothetical protein
MAPAEEVQKTMQELQESIVGELEALNKNVDLLELEQDLLDKYLTKVLEQEDEGLLVTFVEQYLEYRETMSVKDAVENVVDSLDIDSDEEDKKED